MSSCTFPSYASRSSTGQFLVFGQSSARAFAVYVISMAVVCCLCHLNGCRLLPIHPSRQYNTYLPCFRAYNSALEGAVDTLTTHTQRIVPYSNIAQLVAKTAVMVPTHSTASITASPTMADPNSTPTVAPTAAAAPNFLCRAQTRFVDSFVPDCVRQEYRRIITSLFTYKYAYIALATTVLFASAEYEQPGYFPRPHELTVGMVCYLAHDICG